MDGHPTLFIDALDRPFRRQGRRWHHHLRYFDAYSATVTPVAALPMRFVWRGASRLWQVLAFLKERGGFELTDNGIGVPMDDLPRTSFAPVDNCDAQD